MSRTIRRMFGIVTALITVGLMIQGHPVLGLGTALLAVYFLITATERNGFRGASLFNAAKVSGTDNLRVGNVEKKRNDGKRTEPTQEQLKRLKLITDPTQRRMLLEAIQRGEDIPDFAWTPVDMKLMASPVVASFHQQIVNTATNSGRDVNEIIASLNPSTLIQHFAQRARKTATASTGYLCSPPFSVSPSLEEFKNCHGYFLWGIFNPYGPTIDGTALIDVPNYEEKLVYHLTLNPFSREDTIYGLIPSEFGPIELHEFFQRLMKSHSAGAHSVVAQCPPSFFIPLYHGWNPDQTRLIAFTIIGQVAADELVQFCRDAEQCPNSPWEVASLERKRTFKELAVRLSEHNSSPPQVHERATIENMQKWWKINTQDGHVSTYVKELFTAWQGAIDHSGFGRLTGQIPNKRGAQVTSAAPEVHGPQELMAVFQALVGENEDASSVAALVAQQVPGSAAK